MDRLGRSCLRAFAQEIQDDTVELLGPLLDQCVPGAGEDGEARARDPRGKRLTHRERDGPVAVAVDEQRWHSDLRHAIADIVTQLDRAKATCTLEVAGGRKALGDDAIGKAEALWFGLVNTEFISVRVEYSEGAPEEVAVTNGGFVAVIDRARGPKRLVGLDASGEVVASRSLEAATPSS